MMFQVTRQSQTFQEVMRQENKDFKPWYSDCSKNDGANYQRKEQRLRELESRNSSTACKNMISVFFVI